MPGWYVRIRAIVILPLFVVENFDLQVIRLLLLLDRSHYLKLFIDCRPLIGTTLALISIADPLYILGPC